MPIIMAHSKALLYSLLIHAVLLVGIVVFYFSKSEPKKVCHEKCHVVRLATLVTPKHTAEIPKKTAPKPKKKTTQHQQKPVIKKVHKEVKPKRQEVAKKVVPKKTVVVTEPTEIIEEPVVEKETRVANEGSKTPVEEKKEATATQIIEAKEEPRITPEEAYVVMHIQEIQTLLSQNLYYPRMARKRGIQGEVLVSFCILSNGDVEHIQVLKSNREILSRAAIKTIENLAGRFPKPSEALTLQVPIRYSLQ